MPCSILPFWATERTITLKICYLLCSVFPKTIWRCYRCLLYVDALGFGLQNYIVVISEVRFQRTLSGRRCSRNTRQESEAFWPLSAQLVRQLIINFYNAPNQARASRFVGALCMKMFSFKNAEGLLQLLRFSTEEDLN